VIVSVIVAAIAIVSAVVVAIAIASVIMIVIEDANPVAKSGNPNPAA
jgi:hypothetical protein